VLIIELTIITHIVLSVETDLVLLVTPTLAALTLGLDQGSTGLGICELVEVGLLVPA